MNNGINKKKAYQVWVAPKSERPDAWTSMYVTFSESLSDAEKKVLDHVGVDTMRVVKIEEITGDFIE